MSALLNFFYLYDPWLAHVFRMAFFSGVIACVVLAYRVYQKQLPQGILLPLDSIGVILALILLSLIPTLINGTNEFAVAKMYVKTLLLFLFGVAIYHVFYCHHQGKTQLIRDLKIGIVVQAVVGIVALMGVAFMIDFALSTNTLLPRFYQSEQEYRLYNLTSSAFFQLSIFYLMLLHFLLAYNVKTNQISPIFVFLLLFIGLISGRTFFMLSVVSILIYFKWRYLPVLFLFAGLVLFFALNFPQHKYVAHALEPVINLLSHQDVARISSSSENLIKNHLFIPTVKQFLMGDGYYYTPDGKYYGGTDSGFIRQVLYGGIGYLMVCFLFTVYFVKRVADNWFDGSWRFMLSTVFILSVLHVKADTYAFPGIMLVLLMFLSLFGTTGKYRIFCQTREVA
ncbi:TPA: hypothetical protein ACPDTQ_000593 [Pasteurella multocida]